jgi:hypothetical protein
MEKLINILKVIICLVLISFIANCKKSTEEPDKKLSIIMHNSAGKISFTYLKNLPPGEITDTKNLYTLPVGWSYRGLSISPAGDYGVIAMYSQQGISKDWEGKIRMYDASDGGLIKEFNKAELVSLMNYPVAEASMFIVNMDWMNDTQLLVHLQPQMPWIESIPQNASLVIDVDKNELVDLKYSNRNSPYTIQAPQHASKVKYTTVINNNLLLIQGNIVKNMSEVSDVDVYFNLK